MPETYIQPLPTPGHSSDVRFTLEPDPPPPPLAPPLPPAAPQAKNSLDKWREEENDDWGVPAKNEDKGKGRAENAEGQTEEGKNKRASERLKRAVTSEAWDDDFVFQHNPAPPVPRSPQSRKTSHSRSRSRPTTPYERQVSSSSGYSSAVPPSTPSHSSRSSQGKSSYSPPVSPGRNFLSTGLGNPSLDSLASAGRISSDLDPTVTLDYSATPRPAEQNREREHLYRSHRPSASTSTARPAPVSQQSTPRSRIPRTSHHPLPPSSPSQRRSPPTDDDFRSITPSLTEDSLHSLTAGEELVTDTDGTEDEGTQVALTAPFEPEQELNSSGGSLFSGLRSVSGSKKWRLGRGGGKEKEKERESGKDSEKDKSSRLFGRRTGPREPEVMVIDREELEQDSNYDALRSRLPRPTRPGDAQFVILGQRARTSAGMTKTTASSGSGGSSIPVPVRTKHSSGASVSTSTSANSKTSTTNNPPVSAKRSSFQFLPLSFNSASRRGSAASSSIASPPPSSGFQPSWREYDGTTSEDGGETTGADMSEFSGDEAVLPSSRYARGRGGRGQSSGPAQRRGARRGGRGGAGTITPSTSFMSTSTRPVSPVESILGGDKSRWNASTVSFASTASAFALRPSSPEPGSGSTIQSRKRKLTKKRGNDQQGDEESAKPATSTKSPPFVSSATGTNGASGTVSRPPRRPQLRQEASMPFAQESDAEVEQRRLTVRQRSVTSPEQHQQQRRSFVVGEKGQVIELDDPDWLGVVPFPPSPRASLEASSTSRAPAPPSSNSLRSPSRILRKVSGADKSHPPVTARTQAEAKAKRGSGLGASLSNILSRSTSALPLGGGGGGGKRAPSPVPSMKSSKSSRSLLVRRASGKRKKKDEGGGEDGGKAIPKSPSLGLLKKKSSVRVSPSLDSPSAGSTSTGSSLLPSPTEMPPRLTQSASAFSFFRPRSSSRSAAKPSAPPSPAKSSMPRPSAEQPARPSVSRTRSSMVRSRPSNALADHSHPPPSQPLPPGHGQLNRNFKMPGSTPPRPHSTISTVSTTSGSTGSYASTLMPLGGYRDAAVAKAMRSQTGPPLSSSNGSGGAGGTGGKPKTPPTRLAGAGHRPSVSLSSIMPLRSASPRPPPPPPRPPPSPENDFDEADFEPHERPRTALGGDRPPTSYFFDEDLAVSESDFSLPRRNSLSDLRIPSRITESQKKIEEDLERVKQFAKGIEDLKALKRQYQQLVQIFVEPPLSSPSHLSPSTASDRPSSAALSKTASAIRRVELDYGRWWEEAQTLIDLGDGKPAQSGPRSKTSPGTLASRRDRCVSLAPETTPTKKRREGPVPSGSETETEETFAAGSVRGGGDGSTGLLSGATSTGGRKPFARQASASSIQTELSVEARQREMLRGVLAPSTKGASLPSRSAPSPRPGLSVVTNPDGQSTPTSSSALRTSSAEEQTPTRGAGRRLPLGLSHTISPTATRQRPPPVPSRRVSRVGAFGIREFLLRLRSKATEELAASVGTLPVSPLTVENLSRPSSSSGSASPARRYASNPDSRPRTPSSFSRNIPPPPLNPPSAGLADAGRRFSTSSSSDEGSDWDADLSPPRNSLVDTCEGRGLGSSCPGGAGRTRTISVGTVSRAGAGGEKAELMILTTEAMPSLLGKVKEVKEHLEACIKLLKGLTV
ncbi:hypothetical protein JCM8547_002431 [Rhodosporidiobolus lusitaniae]